MTPEHVWAPCPWCYPDPTDLYIVALGSYRAVQCDNCKAHGPIKQNPQDAVTSWGIMDDS